MKGMELRALVCARCLLGVEKVGRDWATEDEVKGVTEVKEIEEARERAGAVRMEDEICGFGEDNMKDSSTKLARE
jgi:hypothetical protein